MSKQSEANKCLRINHRKHKSMFLLLSFSICVQLSETMFFFFFADCVCCQKRLMGFSESTKVENSFYLFAEFLGRLLGLSIMTETAR